MTDYLADNLIELAYNNYNIEKQEKSFSYTIGAEQTATKRRIKSENRKSQEERAESKGRNVTKASEGHGYGQ